MFTLLSLVGCKGADTLPRDKVELQGTVYTTTKTDNVYTTILIKDDKGDPYFVYFNNPESLPIIKAGDTVKIVFDGIVRESYPMQITADEIRVVSGLKAEPLKEYDLIITEGRYIDSYFIKMIPNQFYFETVKDFESFKNLAEELRLGSPFNEEEQLEIINLFNEEFFTKKNIHLFMIPTSSTPSYNVRNVLKDNGNSLYLMVEKISSLNQTQDIFFKAFILSTEKELEVKDATLFMDTELFDELDMPGIRITIEDPGIGDAAIELIYEDEYYSYYLTSIRSNNIMITFTDGLVISLREALDSKKITITDLILNGLNVVIQPKN
jgi:hypothetical protein